MSELKTDPAILEALQRAAARQLTPEERHRQRVSFVMGSLKKDSRVTRAEVEAILDDSRSAKRGV